jgi:tetratricopeptide (TPR) repeat protein
VLQLRGDGAAALEAAVTAASLDAKAPEIAAKLGELCAANGQYERALAAYRTATADLTAVDRAVVHDFLAVLDEAERTSPPALTPTDHMAELERLAALTPDDPFLPVAMARMDIKLDTRNPSFAVARAYARLERFRLRHKDRSLESLSPGSAEAWVDFHLVLDPVRAEKLLEGELELEPGALAPWLLLGRVYTAEGKTKEAVDQFAIAFGLAPQKHVTREHMRARVWTEMSVDAVNAIMRQVMEAEGRTRPDEELLGLAARALYNMGPSGIGRAIPFVEPGIAPSDNAPSAIERIGWMRALVWAARGEPDDLARVQKTVNRILPLIVDPYKKTMAIALLGIARTGSAPRAP